MIRFGLIGTNWITDGFLASTAVVEGFKLTAVYSREKADIFAKKHAIPHTYTDLWEMAASGMIDAVYIASRAPCMPSTSPMLCMSHDIHLLCEKPL